MLAVTAVIFGGSPDESWVYNIGGNCLKKRENNLLERFTFFTAR